jgi:hypothetical protein
MDDFDLDLDGVLCPNDAWYDEGFAEGVAAGLKDREAFEMGCEKGR